MDRFIRECAPLFHDRQLGNHLSLFFCIQFFKKHINIAFQHALTFVMEKKITLVGDACFKPSITIRSHNLHEGNIRKVVGEITSYHEKD